MDPSWIQMEPLVSLASKHGGYICGFYLHELIRQAIDPTSPIPPDLPLESRIYAQGEFDLPTPPGLKAYTRWFPMVLLINGTLWNQALAGEAVDFKEGVLIWRGRWLEDEMYFISNQDPDLPEWIETLSPDQMKALTGPPQPIPLGPLPEDYLSFLPPLSPPLSSPSRPSPIQYLIGGGLLIGCLYLLYHTFSPAQFFDSIKLK